MRQDRRLLPVGRIINRLDGDFVASPKILTPADLKGKNLDVQSIGGGILGYTFSKTVQHNGFRVLQDFANIDIPYQGIGIVARKSFLDQSPESPSGRSKP
jgi:hypothetical protein